MSYNGKLVLDGEAADGDIEIYADGRNYPAYEIAVVPDNDLTEHERDTNARRIVACWNACAGLPTEQLELLPHGGVINATAALLWQRDELLAALVAFREDVSDNRHAELASVDPYSIDQEVLDKIDAAIARAKGGAA